jgi:acyl-CoA synthetase (AMP-forming)/AMP-acid ligase II
VAVDVDYEPLSVTELPLKITLDDALERAAARWPDRVGWVFEDERITFAQMRDRSRPLAATLAREGIGCGDVVAVWLPNVPEWAYAFFACARLGALIASLNTRWSAAEAKYVLEHCKASALILRPHFLRSDFSAILAEVDPRLKTVLPNYPDGDPAAAEPLLLPLRRTVEATDVRPVRWLVATAGTSSSCDLRPQDPFLVQYTSGSTARPKAAVLSHMHVLNFGIELAMRMGVKLGESVLNTQPVYHVGGSCSAIPVPLALGCTMVMPEYYAPERVLQLLERERCVARTGMPTMYLREMGLKSFRDYDTSSLRAGWTIGPPGVMDRIHDEFPLDGLIQLYGSSEAGSTCGDPSDPWEVRRRSAGKPKTGTEFGIFDPGTDEQLGPSAIGEIRIRGWCHLLRYLGDEGSTRAVDSDGWFRTGDLGWLDEDGRLYYEGRLKEMIKPGGENVSAQEVEAVLSTHEAVGQVAVVSVPDPDLVEAVLAVIELAPSCDVSETELQDFCRARLARFKVPRHVRFVDAMPLTDSGKVKKAVLAARFADEFAQ